MNSLSDLSPVLIPIIALMIPIVSVIAIVVLKIVRMQLLHETIRQISASGQTVPSELLNEIVNTKASLNNR
ncbi:hypothetical protein H8K32_10885 [Undibacterium jejuense]|uniref:Uncharacterized protein n=1 Tax=Undibacterium jejuense TaxID=1344949 RepID=A0A923HJ06_9BURK|nr:hypothetical protein [Undibacterium jejuense]MBC3862607.1 hypothetical protein [Undibacterium jejuense]